MTIRYVTSMDQYGPAVGYREGVTAWHLGNDNLLGDGWSDVPRRSAGVFLPLLRGEYNIAAPTWGARAGDYALIADSADVSANSPWTKTGSESMRLTIPGATDTVRLIHFAFSISELPLFDRASGYIIDFLNTAGEIRGSLSVSPSGRLVVTDGSALTCTDGSGVTAIPVSLVATSAPVIQAQTWYYLSIQITTNGVDGNVDLQVYIGDIVPANKVIDASGIAFTNRASGKPIEILGFLPASFTGGGATGATDQTIRAVRDIVIADTSGTYNNSLLGQCFVSAQEIRDEDAGGGWVPYPRRVISDGILDSHTNSTGVRFADGADFEIGASDFTWESEVRFAAIPAAGVQYTVVGKWRTDTANRSYRLYYNGTDSTLRWEVSVDGTNAIVVKSIPWLPVADYTYHIAVSRSAGTTHMFINGAEVGVGVADANTYFNGTGSLGIGARYDSTSTIPASTAFNGWLDETRFTLGVGRYTASFAAPTVPFGRDIGSDPSFASVKLLLGYEGNLIVDASAVPHTANTVAPAVTAITPADGTHPYDVLGQRPAWDDTFLEASNTFAEGILTLTALPLDGETVTVGAKTYTYRTAFTGSPINEVIIGADVAASLANLTAAVNAGAGAGTTYGTGTTANASASAVSYLSPQLLFRAITIGAGGNAIVTTETLSNGFFGAATLTGGTDIPADSQFAIERLPVDATGVRGIQVTARTYKTDAGTATMRFDLIGPSGGVAAGGGNAPDLNPAWTRQVFEEDPDTAASITPSTMIAGRLRIKRTA